jgi:hypothetical protein
MTLTEAHQVLIERHKRACDEIHHCAVHEFTLAENDPARAERLAEERRSFAELARFNRVMKSLEAADAMLAARKGAM